MLKVIVSNKILLLLYNKSDLCAFCSQFCNDRLPDSQSICCRRCRQFININKRAIITIFENTENLFTNYNNILTH